MSAPEGFGETNPGQQMASSGETDWQLIQYRVDFKPDEKTTFIRKMLVCAVREQLPKYMFDGSVMFTTQRLNNDKSPVVLATRRKSDDTLIQITITEVDEVIPADHQYMQFFNNLLSQCQEKLDMELLDRNYSDQEAAKIREDFKLQLWSEYVTSTLWVVLRGQVSNRAFRMDTVLDQLHECYKRDTKNFMTNATKMLQGSIVMTTYNSKLYMINEICWDKTIHDTFELKDGSKMTFKEYYKHKYNCEISSLFQPLLMSQPKLCEACGGGYSPIYLVPELCSMTGLSDEMCANSNLNKDMAEELESLRISNLNKAMADELAPLRINETPETEQLGEGNSAEQDKSNNE